MTTTAFQLFDSGEAVEEAGASNFFAVYPNNTLVTPPLSGTILPGITRDSIILLARNECGMTVLEQRLPISELQNASEAFCCGTGASITPVGRVRVTGKDDDSGGMDIVFGDGEAVGPQTKRLQKLLLDIQMGTASEELNKKYEKWMHIVHG